MPKSQVFNSDMLQESDLARMSAWPREFLVAQTAVSAAGEDLGSVLGIVLDSCLRLIPAADGGEVELRQGKELVCRAASGTALRALGEVSAISGNLPGFCSISAKQQFANRGGPETDGQTVVRSSIIAPVPFEGEQVGVVRLHSESDQAFNHINLLAVQLLAGLINLGLARDALARGERARLEVNRRFEATFQQAAVGIAHVAPDGRFMMVNDRFCEIAGRDRATLTEGGFQTITHPDDLDTDMAHVSDLLAGRASTYSMEKRYLRKNGTIVWVNLTVALVRKPDGTPEFFVSVIEDISARRAAEIDAEHDQLTGLLNRRGVLKQLDRVMSCEGVWQSGVAVAFIDLDEFKSVNDRYGHAEGDRCLIKVGSALRKSLRSEDMIARLGGDEYLAMFSAADEKSVMEVLKRVRSELDNVSEGEQWNVGASIGVVIVPSDAGMNAEAVLIAADRLMYRAKFSSCDGPQVQPLTRAA